MHRYQVGEKVQVRAPPGSNAVKGTYEVVRLQPNEDGAPPSYLVKSLDENHVRSVKEDWIAQEDPV